LFAGPGCKYPASQVGTNVRLCRTYLTAFYGQFRRRSNQCSTQFRVISIPQHRSTFDTAQVIQVLSCSIQVIKSISLPLTLSSPQAVCVSNNPILRSRKRNHQCCIVLDISIITVIGHRPSSRNLVLSLRISQH